MTSCHLDPTLVKCLLVIYPIYLRALPAYIKLAWKKLVMDKHYSLFFSATSEHWNMVDKPVCNMTLGQKKPGELSLEQISRLA